MGTLRQDFSCSRRMLAENPGFALIAVLTLALGIGSSAAIFGVVDHVLA
jgi:putative ABC transport system permease protein